jgi:hypothetical protein
LLRIVIANFLDAIAINILVQLIQLSLLFFFNVYFKHKLVIEGRK